MQAQTARLTAADFDPELLKLFDRYVHGLVDRSGFLAGATRFVRSGETPLTLLEALNPKFAQAQQTAPSDARLRAEFVELPSPAESLTGGTMQLSGRSTPSRHVEVKPCRSVFS